MECKLENGTLTIFLKGELNSSNAEDIEKEIDQTINKNKFKCLILDLKDLTYISSAGLRIIIKLKQKFNETSVINTSADVYNIFDMVGFTSFLKISRLVD